MRLLSGLSEIAPDYDGFILDLWGVVHDGRAPFPGTLPVLRALKAAGKPVVFLTNAPRRAHVIEAQLSAMGIPRDLYAAVVSSGEVARALLRDRRHPFFAPLPPRAFHIGPERDLTVLEGLPDELVAHPSEAGYVLNTGPEPRLGQTGLAGYLPLLSAARAAGLPMVCVNPDRHVVVGGETIIAAGTLADAYLDLGGRVFEVGKPDPMVYGPAVAALGLPPGARVLALGDGPRTDLPGAARAGLDCVWVLEGLAAAHARGGDRAAMEAEATAHGGRPFAAIPGLIW
ncbi:MAG: TIGR01459 family HAD-type hydrolase [Acetobacteraceae bacterium]|nr:TIGR01459 family HAD-type hydrolase [Acetobacteraceae bacterium]MCX7685138.1 TIGR01459 family HAD-type hydrolase [Acetobacteraceae bacterium]MDW8398860.1 TIGR01459 family HAD-type hydrolase [Acetobacteraceae bacterium]